MAGIVSLSRSIAIRLGEKQYVRNWQIPKYLSDESNEKQTHSSNKRKDSDAKKHLVKKGTEVEKISVRRTTIADVPLVLNYVKVNARNSWPHLIGARNPSTKVVMTDMVTRILSQGHSYIAEKKSPRKEVKGLALNALICPWDALMVEKFASCLRCSATKKLMTFTAYCMKAPNLHNKYRIHSLMQVTLIVPPSSANMEAIVHALAKQTIEHGRKNQIPLIRFDVTNDEIVKELEKFKFKKEWEVPMKVLPSTMKVTPSHRRVVRQSTNETKIIGEDKSVYRVFSTIPGNEKANRAVTKNIHEEKTDAAETKDETPDKPKE